MDQMDAIVCSFAGRIKPGVKVILSLEDKSIADKYPKDWIILQEPVSDIHSLIYYSKLVISSGDSMAREGAMLGVQAVYCGIREMKANQLLINEGILHHYPIEAGLDFINEQAGKPFDTNAQSSIRQRLKDKWVDMIDFMHTQINSYKR
jgi:hypothetical protein